MIRMMYFRITVKLVRLERLDSILIHNDNVCIAQEFIDSSFIAVN